MSRMEMNSELQRRRIIKVLMNLDNSNFGWKEIQSEVSQKDEQ